MKYERVYPKLSLPLVMYKETGSVRKGTKKQHYVVPTWNHIYHIVRNRVVLDKWAKLYKENIALLTKEWIEENEWETTRDTKVYVDMWVYFHDAYKRDTHNLDKLILDAFEDAGIYDDDMNALLRFQDFQIDIDNPRIEVKFTRGEYYHRREEAEKQRELKRQKEREERERKKETAKKG